MFARKAYTMGHMKKNISILIGIVVLFAVLYGGQSLMKDRKQAEVSDVASSTATQVVLGSVMRVFEGEREHAKPYAHVAIAGGSFAAIIFQRVYCFCL